MRRIVYRETSWPCRIGLILGGLCMAANASAQVLPSFPGAEGFGAVASGGRGGQVLTVTTLAADPAGQQPGSLGNNCGAAELH